jgi:hypothetical protein
MILSEPNTLSARALYFGSLISFTVVKPLYVGHILFPFEAALVMQVGNLREPLDTVKIEVCTITCGNVQFRVQ